MSSVVICGFNLAIEYSSGDGSTQRYKCIQANRYSNIHILWKLDLCQRLFGEETDLSYNLLTGVSAIGP